MIDLHVHILPGLDDGARTMEDAIEMAALAMESGVKRLVATPHSNQRGRFENYDSEMLRQAYGQLQQALHTEGLSIPVDLGMEIFASEDLKEQVAKKRLFGLGCSQVYLMEFPFEAEPMWIGQRLEDMMDLGVRPLMAHPERYFCVQEYPGLVYDWIQLGCLTQLNRGSAFGRFGRQAKLAAEHLLDNDLITCIASDAHSPYMRTTYMEDIRNYIEEQYGENTAYRLLCDNPKRILDGGRIAPHGRIPERQRGFFW